MLLQKPGNGVNQSSPETPSLKMILASPVTSMDDLNNNHMPPPGSSDVNTATSPFQPSDNSNLGATDENKEAIDKTEKEEKLRSGSFISKLKNFRLRSESSPISEEEITLANSLAIKSTEKVNCFLK